MAAEPPDTKQFAGFKRSALARLKDAANPVNALESRFDLAYDAAHGLCLTALRHKGFRAHHVTSCFRRCHTLWDQVRKSGECLTSVIRFEIVESMNAI